MNLLTLDLAQAVLDDRLRAAEDARRARHLAADRPAHRARTARHTIHERSSS